VEPAVSISIKVELVLMFAKEYDMKRLQSQ